MRVALAQICVDHRLNHEQLRIQMNHKLAAHYLKADRVLVLNEIGGNAGSNFRNSVNLFLSQGATIVLAAVLHHDDCVAHQAGARHPIEETLQKLNDFLVERDVSCLLVGGNIITANNHIIWDDNLTSEVAPASTQESSK